MCQSRDSDGLQASLPLCNSNGTTSKDEIHRLTTFFQTQLAGWLVGWFGENKNFKTQSNQMAANQSHTHRPF